MTYVLRGTAEWCGNADTDRSGETQGGSSHGRDRLQSPLTPGVIFFFGVLWTLVGSAVLYLLAAWDDGGEQLRAFLIIVQFAAWVIGGYMIVIAGIAWAVTVGIRSARD